MAIAGVHKVPPFDDDDKRIVNTSKRRRIVRVVDVIKNYDEIISIDRLWSKFEDSVNDALNDGYVNVSDVQVILIKNVYLMIFQEFAKTKL